MKMAFLGAAETRADARRADLRGDAAALAQAYADEGRILALWRGKPLVEPCGSKLHWLAANSPVLAHRSETVFLGYHNDLPHFACDISDWSPEAGAEAVEAGFYDPSKQFHPALGVAQAFVELRGLMALLSAREAELAATAKALLHWHRSHRFCAVCGARSEVAQGGWQRNCPSCAAPHFPRTDPVVIMLVERGDSVLLGRSPGWPEGMYSCLAGFIEPGETAEAAVAREVFEETRIEVSEARYFASQPWPFPASLMLGFFAKASAQGEIEVDPAELEHAIWLSRADVALVLAGEHGQVKAPREGSIARALMVEWSAKAER